MSCEKIPEIINNLAYIKSEVNNVTTILKVSMFKVAYYNFFRDLVARATIAWHTSVLAARAKMTQVTSRITKNHFST